MKAKNLGASILPLICVALIVVASPALGDCLPCFGATPGYCGGTGADYYIARIGEVVAGNDGDDKLSGNLGNEKICGNQGNDQVSGVEANDYLIGNGGNDSWVHGGPGDDFVAGGNGNDLILGGSEFDNGYDILNGGSGFDTCYYGDVYTDCEVIHEN